MSKKIIILFAFATISLAFWFQRVPAQEVETVIASFVIGGVTLREDVKNPPVPSGRQRFEVTVNKPVVSIRRFPTPETLPRFNEADSLVWITFNEIYNIDRDFVSYPIDLIVEFVTATDLAVTPDRFTLTGTVNLPTGTTYQVLAGQSDPDPIYKQQQYFFGTVELSDAVVSGIGVLPEGVRVRSGSFPGWVGLVNPHRFQKIHPLLAVEDDIFSLAIVRVDDIDDQQMFELKHVPDGAYAMFLSQDVISNRTGIQQAFTQIGMDIITGEVDSTKFIHIVNGKSITDLQIPVHIESAPLPVRGDLDGDGDIDFSDFLIFAEVYSLDADDPHRLFADIDGNGVVDFNDFLTFVDLFGKG